MTIQELDELEKRLKSKDLTLAEAKKIALQLMKRVNDLEDDVYSLQENIDDLENALEDIRNGF